MAARPVLLVVVVNDRTLRAMLETALTRIGVKASGFIAGSIRQPQVLLLDRAADDAWHRIEAEWLAGRWVRILVMGAERGCADAIEALPGDWAA